MALDLESAPFAGINTSGDYPDTLHADYAFIITLQPMTRGMAAPWETDSSTTAIGWNFELYPNPAGESFNLVLSDSSFPRDIAIYDVTGRRMLASNSAGARVVPIQTGSFASGAYVVRVTDAGGSKQKNLIIR